MKRVYASYSNAVRLRVLRMMVEYKMTLSEISKATKISIAALYRMHDSFVKYGTYKKQFSTGRPFTPIPEEVERFLLDGLQEHRFLSLRKRCQMVKERFDFSLDEKKLGRMFRRHGVQYQKCK